MYRFILFLSFVIAATGQNKAEYPLDLSKIKIELPQTADPELNRLMTSKKTIFYKLPPAWQHYYPASRIESKNLTLNTTNHYYTKMIYGLYYTTHNPDMHANANFPWETTIGLNSSHKNPTNPYKTFNFVHLPEPVLIINELPIKWIFPVGTTLGEVIYTTHKEENYIQEIRTRTKNTDSLDWEPAVYRPIASREEFKNLVQFDYKPSYKYFHFRNPQEDEVFKMEGLVEQIPNINENTVKSLLKRPFKKVSIDGNAWSPAAIQDFHILPKDYCFSLLDGVDVRTCASCHRQSQISVRNLTPKDPDVLKTPSKIGNIRGSDTGFTWYPFSEKVIRKSDKDPDVNLDLRDYDRKNNFVKIALGTESTETYRLTKFVQESLEKYELPPARYLHAPSKTDMVPNNSN